MEYKYKKKTEVEEQYRRNRLKLLKNKIYKKIKKKLIIKINYMNTQSFIAVYICFVVFEWSLLSPSRCFFFNGKTFRKFVPNKIRDVVSGTSGAYV